MLYHHASAGLLANSLLATSIYDLPPGAGVPGLSSVRWAGPGRGSLSFRASFSPAGGPASPDAGQVFRGAGVPQTALTLNPGRDISEILLLDSDPS